MKNEKELLELIDRLKPMLADNPTKDSFIIGIMSMVEDHVEDINELIRFIDNDGDEEDEANPETVSVYAYQMCRARGEDD